MRSQRALSGLVFFAGIFIFLSFFAWIFSKLDFTFYRHALAVLQVDGANHSLFLGNLPASVFFLSLALMILNVVNELFGKRTASLLSIMGGLVLTVSWVLVSVMPWFPMIEDFQRVETLAGILDLSQKGVLVFAVVFAFAFPLQAFLFELFRHLTHNRFAIIRLVLPFIFGLAALSAATVYLELLPNFSLGQALALGLTRYIQWLGLSLALIPLYYTVELFGLLIVGKDYYAEVKKSFARKPIFKPEAKDFFEARQEVQAGRI